MKEETAYPRGRSSSHIIVSTYDDNASQILKIEILGNIALRFQVRT